MINAKTSSFIIATCLLQISFPSNTAIPEETIEKLIQTNLTPTNALFPRTDAGENIPARTLFIFLDDSEDQIGAVTFNVLTALYQKSCPLLVSGKLLHNIFSRPLDEKKYAATKEALLAEMRKNEGDIRLEDDDFILHEIVTAFDPQEWIIKLPLSSKEWGQALFLLIPKNYLTEKKLPVEPNNETLFKLKNMETIPDSRQAWEKRFKEKASSELSNKAFMQLINNNLLFTNPPLLSQSKTQWAVYLGGHGSRESVIAGLSIKKNGKQKSEFQELL